MSDPVEPVRKLMEQFSKAVEGIGMHVHTFALVPNPDPGGPHSVQAILVFQAEDLALVDNPLEDDAPLSTDEADAFDMLARDFVRDTDAEKADEARARLEQMAKDLADPNRGILGDD